MKAEETTVLVTGSAGFIGTHLVQRLLDLGHTVVGLDLRATNLTHSKFIGLIGSIINKDFLDQTFDVYKPTIVYHLAARTDLAETQDIEGYDANITGVKNIVSSIKKNKTVRRAVCTSSQLVCRLGYTPNGPDDYLPNTLYGQSKVLTEKIWRSADGGGVEWCIVRPTTVWGPRMNPHYLTFFRMIKRGVYFHVGKAPTYKSYGYVGNVIHQFEKLGFAPNRLVHRNVFYVADYEQIEMREWANAFAIELNAPKIRTIPMSFAEALAKIGDSIKKIGWNAFPFTTFRLRNVQTSFLADTKATEQVCGALPFSWRRGVEETSKWLLQV